MEEAKLKKPSSPKERNLLKGAIRRVFSRSELRREAIKKNIVQHSDPLRQRVKTWAYCSDCGIIDAVSNFQVDHDAPLVPLHKTLEDMSWDEVVDRTWCDINNLRPLCKPCHKDKTKIEAKERRRLKKDRG